MYFNCGLKQSSYDRCLKSLSPFHNVSQIWKFECMWDNQRKRKVTIHIHITCYKPTKIPIFGRVMRRLGTSWVVMSTRYHTLCQSGRLVVLAMYMCSLVDVIHLMMLGLHCRITRHIFKLAYWPARSWLRSKQLSLSQWRVIPSKSLSSILSKDKLFHQISVNTWSYLVVKMPCYKVDASAFQFLAVRLSYDRFPLKGIKLLSNSKIRRVWPFDMFIFILDVFFSSYHVAAP